MEKAVSSHLSMGVHGITLVQTKITTTYIGVLLQFTMMVNTMTMGIANQTTNVETLQVDTFSKCLLLEEEAAF